MLFNTLLILFFATQAVAAPVSEATKLSEVVNAQTEFTPTYPGPGQSFRAGSICTIQWTPDVEGEWTHISIDLMSGSNTNMTRVMNVITGLVGSSGNPETSYNWTCPKVQPYSAIYFYEFTNGDGDTGTKWTTRFTITSPTGKMTEPEFSTQDNGDLVPWGRGALVTKSSNLLSFNKTKAAAPPMSSLTTAPQSNEGFKRTLPRVFFILLSIVSYQYLCD